MKQVILSKIIKELVRGANNIKLREIFDSMHIVDIAEVMNRLSYEERKAIYLIMEPVEIAEMLTELNSDFQEELISVIENITLKKVFEEMSNDDIVDIFGEISQEEVAGLMKLLDKNTQTKIRRLSSHEEDTAGGLMTTDYFAVKSGTTIRTILKDVKARGKNAELLYYIYIVEEKTNVLKGISTLRELILSDPNMEIDDLMETKIITVSPNIDQEQVAIKFSKYDLLALPVVNERWQMLGIITVDDILDVLEEEATEDIYTMAGLTEEEMENDRKFFNSVKVRFPWLMVSFFGELISAFIMQNGESALTIRSLIFFVPLVMATGGNSGSQSSAVMVRKIALGETGSENLKNIIFKESLAGLILGLISGVMVGGVSFLWYGKIYLGVIVGISLFIVISSASIFGILIPLLFNKFKMDPAVASGPFITTLNDILGLLIYFTIAISLIGIFGG